MNSVKITVEFNDHAYGKVFTYMAYLGEKITHETRIGFGETPIEAIADLDNHVDFQGLILNDQ